MYIKASERNWNMYFSLIFKSVTQKITNLKTICHCIPERMEVKEQLKSHNFHMFTSCGIHVQ